MYWLPIALSLGYLWFRLINNLRLEWMTDPQYGYGMIVPFLCLGLILRRWAGYNSSNENRPGDGVAGTSTFCLIACFAFLYLPIRLVEAATPEWRIIQWALGMVIIGLTLGAIRVVGGRGWLRQLVFPIVFFLVAIPWPTIIEAPLIQNLTRAGAVVVMELLYLCGVPALLHGNLIEVGTGMVGIDEACSGIRSFQTSLMTSLFFGEFYCLRWSRRCLLIPVGLGLAMVFNIGRMFFLTMIAAKKGMAAISDYHDPAGVSTAIFCTLLLWLLAHLLHRRQSRIPRPSTESAPASSVISGEQTRPAHAFRLGAGLLVWLIVVETGVLSWYRIREETSKPAPDWTLNFPEENPSVKTIPIDDTTRNLLRYDEGKEATWNAADGAFWQAFYFDWREGRVAGYLAKRHTPEICLTAMGLKMQAGPQLNFVNIHGVDLPIRSYVFANENSSVQVFHCRWEAGADRTAYVQNDSARYNLIRAVWAGRGNRGQKVFEVIISGISDPQQAWEELTNQLDQLIVVKPSRH